MTALVFSQLTSIHFSYPLFESGSTILDHSCFSSVGIEQLWQLLLMKSSSISGVKTGFQEHPSVWFACISFSNCLTIWLISFSHGTSFVVTIEPIIFKKGKWFWNPIQLPVVSPCVMKFNLHYSVVSSCVMKFNIHCSNYKRLLCPNKLHWQEERVNPNSDPSVLYQKSLSLIKRNSSKFVPVQQKALIYHIMTPTAQLHSYQSIFGFNVSLIFTVVDIHSNC